MSENRSSALTQHERIALIAFKKPYAKSYLHQKQPLKSAVFLA